MTNQSVRFIYPESPGSSIQARLEHVLPDTHPHTSRVVQDEPPFLHPQFSCFSLVFAPGLASIVFGTRTTVIVNLVVESTWLAVLGRGPVGSKSRNVRFGPRRQGLFIVGLKRFFFELQVARDCWKTSFFPGNSWRQLQQCSRFSTQRFANCCVPQV